MNLRRRLKYIGVWLGFPALFTLIATVINEFFQPLPLLAVAVLILFGAMVGTLLKERLISRDK